MSLEDYMKKEEEKRKNMPPTWVKFYYPIDTYDIPKDKKELVKGLSKYIKKYDIEHNLNYLLRMDDTTMMQIATINDNRMAALINIIDKTYDYEREEPVYINISEEEFKKRTTKYQKLGSQKFYDYSFGYHWKDFQSVNMGIQHIYYSLDGYVYINSKLAKKLKDVDIEELGMAVAKQANILKDDKRTGFCKDVKDVNRALENYYERGEIPHYRFENDELQYLGPKLIKKR